jgi:Tol biopolymer transport system component
MNVFCKAVVSVVAIVCAAFAAAQAPAPLTDEAKARKAIDNARIFEQQARTLTLFDRHGKRLNTVGARALYGNPAFAQDGTKLAYVKRDLEKENADLWIIDVATGREVQITSGNIREQVSRAVWSADGAHVVYTALRDGKYGVYRHAASGEGGEELLYASPGIAVPTDWTSDGKTLSLGQGDLGGSVVSSLQRDGSGQWKPTEIFRSPKQIQPGRLSPDSRLLAYVSNESGKNEVYVRPFAAGASSGGPWQISEQGGVGMTSWRKDGKELYFMAADQSIMAVAVTTSPAVAFAKPQVLFKPNAAIAAGPGTVDITTDGERLVIGVPPPQLRQLTLYNRQGEVIRTAGEPTQFVTQTHFSPDGKKLVYMKLDTKTAQIDIFTYDLETNQETNVTQDNWNENAPIWSRDGKHVLYASTREQYASIYRKNRDGSGEEEMLFRYTPGAGIVLTDESPDGKFLTFYTGVLVLVPLGGTDALARKPIEWLRDEYDNVDAKFSPDGRFVAYCTDPDDPMTLDVFVRPFDASKPDAPPAGDPVRISKGGTAAGMVTWRGDGKELYYMTRDFEVMAVDVSTTPSFKAGTPKALFKLPSQPLGNAAQWNNVSPDGQRFVFSMPSR